ncbi:hypothetical protein [Kitasatospora sp. GP82]|nr:hypothetical protein [Kitasatospora sp. GP82]MDH6124856.1 hypothetical protein [Kitasatospora sp. GP82]
MPTNGTSVIIALETLADRGTASRILAAGIRTAAVDPADTPERSA